MPVGVGLDDGGHADARAYGSAQHTDIVRDCAQVNLSTVARCEPATTPCWLSIGE